MSDRKIDPDLLLLDLKLGQVQSKKGSLRIFLGMCPGVGKTFAMLKAAKERQNEGVDVVVGLVETHGRKETEEVLSGLELIDRHQINYKGTLLTELNLDAVLKRKPKLVLVDELAHTNIPGSRHAKRYLDVLEILSSGIDVYTTVNIQHIDTRSVLVTQITGIKINETVPDSILSEAKQVDLIDLTPEELLKRLKEGKVYLGERAQRAQDNFFKLEHLIALRELSLRFTAELVDQHLRIEMGQKGIQGPWNTNERLLVAISHSPYSQTLIRATRRKAFSLEAPWIALYVNTNSFLAKEDQEQLHKNISLAKELGAEFITITDSNLVEAIKRIAIQRNVSQIIIGRPDKRFTDFINRGTILDRLTREASNIDIHVLRQERPTVFKSNLKSFFVMHSGMQLYYNAFWLICVFSIINYSIVDFVGYRSVGFIYLFLVLIVSSFAGKGPILFTAFISAFIWDYFFIPPRFTFLIRHQDDIMMSLTYLIVAMVTGSLAHQRNRQKEILIAREEVANYLYRTIKELSEAQTIEEIANCSVRSIEKFIPAKSYFFVLSNREQHLLNRHSISGPTKYLEDKEHAVMSWAILNKKSAGWSTETLSSSTIMAVPIFKKDVCYGAILIEPARKFQLTLIQENTLDAIFSNITFATERFYLSKDNEDSRLAVESEKLHQSLLNSISHEIKTPITSIMGIAHSLNSEINLNQDKMVSDLMDSALRLNRVVENLLDMSRISNGHLRLNMEYFDLVELISNVINSNAILINRFDIIVQDKDFYILGDTKLIEHAFFNIFLNAIQYSPKDQKITINIDFSDHDVFIKVIDHGPGLKPGEEQKIFDRFYRSADSRPGGTGLGLSIVKEVFEMHSGKVLAYNNLNQGCTFEVQLKFKSELK